MNTTTVLLDHQKRAVAKLMPYRVGGLFMDMGTGKTRVVIELAAQRQLRISNVVYFCPVSLKETVRRELLTHTDLSESDIYMFGSRTTIQKTPKAFWYIIGIESMSSSDRQVLAANAIIDDRSMAVVDESGYIKGHNSIRTQRITKLGAKARFRIIMTGTPLSQGIIDLYAQMRFLSWRILGYKSFYTFAHNHLQYSDKYPGMIVSSHNTDYLAAKVQPYTYQVTKAECLDLPDKTYTTYWHEMTQRQRSLYEQAKMEILADIDASGEFDSYTIFRLFSSLQQIVCGFWNRKTEDGTIETITFPHARLNVFASAVAQIPAGEKVVIWSKYLRNIDEIVQRLRTDYGADSVAQFHGRLNEEQRNEELNKFRNQARFFVATQSSGGQGLTLNEAAFHIFYSNGFKYSERIQAEDRSHRIGQKRNVHYIDIVCDSSIDDRISQALHDKAGVLERFKRQVDNVKDKKSAEVRKLIESL